MNKEEKEAIEQLKSWRDYIIKNKDKVNKANDIEFYLRTVLNLIQKQDKIIDKMAEHIYKGCDFDNRIKTKKQIIEYFKKEVEKDVKD